MADTLRLDFAPAAQRFTVRMRDYGARLTTRGSEVVREQMGVVRQAIIATTPVDTGALRASWSPTTRGANALAWQVSTDLPYATTLEYGGYTRVGPKTVALGGGSLGETFVAGAGIYSKQAPLGWVRRALADAAPGFRQRLAAMAMQVWNQSGQRLDMNTEELTRTFGVPIVEQL